MPWARPRVCHVFCLDRHLCVVDGFLSDPAAFSMFYRAHARGLLLFFTRRTFDAEAARARVSRALRALGDSLVASSVAVGEDLR
jgi:hypothetical protein